jgi:DNA-binding NtrC family response regulator
VNVNLATVLIVDDEENIRCALRRELEMLDCTVLVADRPTAAMELLRKQPIDVVISDNTMPGMSGLQFLRIVRQQYPGAIRIMLTGSATLETAIEAINKDEIFRFLQKPWDEQDLKMTVIKASEKRKALTS